MITIYRTEASQEYFDFNGLSIEELILQDQDIKYTIVVDNTTTKSILRGLALPNPVCAQVLVCNGGAIIKNYFDLMAWIDVKGLRSC